MAINIAGSLQTTVVNLPLDARSRIATLDDVASIVNPALGGIFYCVATGRHYKITKLKAQTSGPFTVADKQVDTYEQLPDKSDLTGKADAEHTHAQYALKTEIPDAVDLNPYLKKTDAATTYASKSDVAGKADAEHTHAQYALKTEIPDAVDLEPYLKKTDAATTYASKSDLAGKADTEHVHAQYALASAVTAAIPPQRIVFDISGLTSSALVSLVIEFDNDASFPDDSTTLETYDSKTDTDGRFIAWGGFELSRYPAAGIGSAYNGGCVIFVVPDSARAKGFYRYAWRAENGESQGNLSSKHFGCLRAVTHQALFEDIF